MRAGRRYTVNQFVSLNANRTRKAKKLSVSSSDQSVMFEELLNNLCKELSSAIPKLTENSFYPVVFNNAITVQLVNLHPGVAMKAQITTCLRQKKEDLFIFLMRANLLGQGTGESRIGLDSQEKYLTLSLGLPYEMNYSLFKEKFEDFINYLVYWREEIGKFEQNLTTVL